jgi:geranylgeranyl diphosphate synthase, type I
VHDDIIDRDRLRRHRTALWAAYGVPAAILLGDALFFLAVQVLAQQGSGPLARTGVVWLTGAVQQLIAGEHADTTFEHHDVAILLSDATEMATAKTASLIATACALGALAGGADTDRVEHLRSYGTHLGQAFQLVDDLLGIWGDPAVTGKPSLADLQARKKSLPVTAALAADNDAAHELARLYTTPTPFIPEQLHRAAELIDQAGGREWAAAQARHHTELALNHLRAAAPEPVAAAALTALAQHTVDRTW